MKNVLKNQAIVQYKSNCSVQCFASNVVVTPIVDRYHLCATKTVLSAGFIPGESLAYVIKVENKGIRSLCDLQIKDCITPKEYLTFLTDSLEVYLDGERICITECFDHGCLWLKLPQKFRSGSVLEVFYKVCVSKTIPSCVQTITNEAQVYAYTQETPSRMIAVSPSPITTIGRGNYADLSITKTADSCDVAIGEELTYSLLIANSGTVCANGVVITDSLPDHFTVKKISLTIGTTTYHYKPCEYTICPNTNVLTLPNSTGHPINVPACGEVVIKICGIVC